VTQDVVGEQPPDLVAAQAPPISWIGGRRAGGDRCRHPVGIGIVRQRDGSIDTGRQRDEQVHRARLFRVREADGRERSVGLLLGLDHVGFGKAGPGEGLDQRRSADPVQRGVGGASAQQFGSESHRRRSIEVRLDERIVQPLDERVVDR
jgi:hypothetical protein